MDSSAAAEVVAVMDYDDGAAFVLEQLEVGPANLSVAVGWVRWRGLYSHLVWRMVAHKFGCKCDVFLIASQQSIKTQNTTCLPYLNI